MRITGQAGGDAEQGGLRGIFLEFEGLCLMVLPILAGGIPARQ